MEATQFTWQKCGSPCQYDVGIEVTAHVDVCSHDGVVHQLIYAWMFSTCRLNMLIVFINSFDQNLVDTDTVTF